MSFTQPSETNSLLVILDGDQSQIIGIDLTGQKESRHTFDHSTTYKTQITGA